MTDAQGDLLPSSTNGRAVALLLRSLAAIEQPGRVDELTHGLQTATRAERAGASEELVVAALCHDMAKALPHTDHARLGAELLRPFVGNDTYWILRTHQTFQAQHFAPAGSRQARGRTRYRSAPWYAAAERFSDEWDNTSLDPDYDTLPLEHFVPALDAVFAQPRPVAVPRWRRLVFRLPGIERVARIVRGG